MSETNEVDAMFSEGAEKAAQYPNLGASYFVAQKIAERFMAHFKEEHFKPLIEDAAREFRDRLWSDVSGWFLSDAENNLASEMRHMVDKTVQALLTGERWALERYVLHGKRYDDGETIREKIAALVPREVQDQRIADLEAEVKKLREDNDSLRRRYT